ncbi:hypothetical protein Taro_030184 [Colocasia esculenta]|uniref:Uncharacterized protein n=1 Tax=Colocasia esculenta TaxID=4460 RepID=A0A843VFP6_COLES|nr:hypothetical protein [Colocasia esculenta]
MGAVSEALPLQERVPVKNNVKRASDLVILFLLIAQLYCRLSSLHSHGTVWRAAFLCESWFAFVWLLNMNAKWNPVKCITYPERITKRFDDLPAVDMFVTTADPKLEPPLVTVNTVLSLLAVEYPAHKLACYVSDDGCSAITCYALVEAAEFARSWVPFCKEYNIRVRAPSVYFSGEVETPHLLSPDFLQEWQVMKVSTVERGKTTQIKIGNTSLFREQY